MLSMLNIAWKRLDVNRICAMGKKRIDIALSMLKALVPGRLWHRLTEWGQQIG